MKSLIKKLMYAKLLESLFINMHQECKRHFLYIQHVINSVNHQIVAEVETNGLTMTYHRTERNRTEQNMPFSTNNKFVDYKNKKIAVYFSLESISLHKIHSDWALLIVVQILSRIL